MCSGEVVPTSEELSTSEERPASEEQSHIVPWPDEADKRAVTINKLISSGALAISVVAVIQFLQLQTPLDPNLYRSLFCFALAIPACAMDLILLTAFGLGKTLPTPLQVIHTYVIGVAGPVAAFAGTVYVIARLDGAYYGPTGVYVGVSAGAFTYTLYLLRTKHIS